MVEIPMTFWEFREKFSEQILSYKTIYRLYPEDERMHMTCSIPRLAVSSHSLVCSENPFSILGIGPIPVKEL